MHTELGGHSLRDYPLVRPGGRKPVPMPTPLTRFNTKKTDATAIRTTTAVVGPRFHVSAYLKGILGVYRRQCGVFKRKTVLLRH